MVKVHPLPKTRSVSRLLGPICTVNMIFPLGQMLSPENPTNGASYGYKSNCLRPRLWNRLGYIIFEQLPWSTSTLLMSVSPILNLMTKGSSYGVWTSLRSSSKKNIYCSLFMRSFLSFLEMTEPSVMWKTS